MTAACSNLQFSVPTRLRPIRISGDRNGVVAESACVLYSTAALVGSNGYLTAQRSYIRPALRTNSAGSSPEVVMKAGSYLVLSSCVFSLGRFLDRSHNTLSRSIRAEFFPLVTSRYARSRALRYSERKSSQLLSLHSASCLVFIWYLSSRALG
jgi:hypothetical protein